MNLLVRALFTPGVLEKNRFPYNDKVVRVWPLILCCVMLMFHVFCDWWFVYLLFWWFSLVFDVRFLYFCFLSIFSVFFNADFNVCPVPKPSLISNCTIVIIAVLLLCGRIVASPSSDNWGRQLNAAEMSLKNVIWLWNNKKNDSFEPVRNTSLYY